MFCHGQAGSKKIFIQLQKVFGNIVSLLRKSENVIMQERKKYLEILCRYLENPKMNENEKENKNNFRK